MQSPDLTDRAAQVLRALIDSAVDGIIVIDARGRIETFNPAAERLFGYTEEDVRGRNVSMLMPSPDREEHDQYLARYQQTGGARIIGIGRDVTGRRRDGTTFPLHLSVGEMRVGDERKFTGIVHDLTARVALEDRLRSSEEHWRSIVESAVDAIVVIDARGHIEAFNPAAERLFGYAPADVIGQNVRMLMPAPYREEHAGYLARYMHTGEAKIIGRGREVTGMRRDGTTFPLHLSVGEVSTTGGQKFIGILHDLSDRVRMEAQIREQAALVRLGEMAAVIAHEIKNPLAGIRGAVQVIGGRLPADSRDTAVIGEIVSRIDALNGMIQDLLVFARPPQPRPTVVDVSPLIALTMELLRRDPALEFVEMRIDGSCRPVLADPELLKIVFQNLIVNSAQAMQGRGRISIIIGVANDACEVRVTDDGPGIPPALQEKIFAPFFTTKSRGTGLGLPTARRLIEAHGGTIHVESPASGGTRVTLRIPLAPA